MSKTIAIIATLDTKGEEVSYLKKQIESKGKNTFIIDSATRSTSSTVKADITSEMMAKAAGSSIEVVQEKGRGEAIEIMVKGIIKVLKEQYALGKFDAIMSIGGLDGTLLASAGMKELPLGVPKFIITPVAQGTQTFGTFVGTSDMIIMHSVIDILGINGISRKIFDNAVGAILGMVDVEETPEEEKKNIIATTMYGNTPPAVMLAKKLLEDMGYEVVVFHPNGTGGKAMEEIMEQGLFTAVLDMTTHEITDQLFDGVHAGRPDRLEAGCKVGLPQIIVPGCVDFILKGPMDTLSEEHKARKTYYFNPEVTLVKASHEEMETVAKVMAEKLNMATGPTILLIPLGGFSMYCHEGEPLYDPEGDQVFIQTIKTLLDPKIKVVELDAHINDPIFARTAVSLLTEMI